MRTRAVVGASLTRHPHRVIRIVKEPTRSLENALARGKKKPRAVRNQPGLFRTRSEGKRRAFRPVIERLRDQISCGRQSEALIDKPKPWASIDDCSRIDDERMRTMRSFCYRVACKQIVALHIHRGAQSTLGLVDCQPRFYRSRYSRDDWQRRISDLLRVLCMNANSRNAIVVICALLFVDVASVSSAQQAISAQQQEVERIREYLDPLRRSRLVGSDDSLAIEMPDGERFSVARSAGCAPPVSSGGVIKVDCTLEDGPAHYFDEATGAMIESCSFWFADAKRCPPRQWPVEVPDCDGAVPDGLTGTWRFYALPAAAGFYPVSAGWAMTLDDGSISFDFYGVGQMQRSYTMVESGDRRYALEIKDAHSATTAIQIELAPCGMLVEADGMCDEFCENLANEFGPPTEAQLRAIVANSLGDSVDEATLERILAEVAKAERPQRPQPLFPKRAYFRAVAAGR